MHHPCLIHQHGGKGSKEEATILQHRYYTGYQTTHERYQSTLDAYITAIEAGSGYCGHLLHLLLQATVSRIHILPSPILPATHTMKDPPVSLPSNTPTVPFVATHMFSQFPLLLPLQ